MTNLELIEINNGVETVKSVSTSYSALVKYSIKEFNEDPNISSKYTIRKSSIIIISEHYV